MPEIPVPAMAASPFLGLVPPKPRPSSQSASSARNVSRRQQRSLNRPHRSLLQEVSDEKRHNSSGMIEWINGARAIFML